MNSSPSSNRSTGDEENNLIDIEAETTKFINELDLAMIKYITADCRILALEQPETWEGFHMSSRGNFEKFDYSPSELCEEFKDVLLIIYQYDLSRAETEGLKLIEYNKEYQRVGDGYKRLEKCERLTASREPKMNIDYRVEKLPFRPPVSPMRPSNVFHREPGVARTLHSVVVPQPLPSQQGGYGFYYKDQLLALLSAMLSDSHEFYRRQMLDCKELHKRLRKAKKDFEQYGKMPENCLSLDDLLSKTNRLHNVRSTLAQVSSVLEEDDLTFY